jgi:hypothetical protein
MKKNKNDLIMITFRVEPVLYKKIMKHLNETGMTRTNFLKRLINKFLDKQ